MAKGPKKKSKSRAKSSKFPVSRNRTPRQILLSALIRDRERYRKDPRWRERIVFPAVASLPKERLPVRTGDQVVKRAFRRTTASIPVIKQFRQIARPVNYVWNKWKICKKRKERKKALFAIRKAGRGIKRSPGKGGTYKKTLESMIPC